MVNSDTIRISTDENKLTSNSWHTVFISDTESFFQDVDELMQGDDPSLGYLADFVNNKDKCPPPPDHTPSDGCKVKQCKSDSGCPHSRNKCCYNGCVFTCMDTLKPPPGTLVHKNNNKNSIHTSLFSEIKLFKHIKTSLHLFSAVIDWLKEPPRRLQAGSSWLVPGPEREVEGTRQGITAPCFLLLRMRSFKKPHLD